MIICLIEWLSNGENFMLNAFPVFEILYSKKFIVDVISVVKSIIDHEKLKAIQKDQLF